MDYELDDTPEELDEQRDRGRDAELEAQVSTTDTGVSVSISHKANGDIISIKMSRGLQAAWDLVDAAQARAKVAGDLTDEVLAAVLAARNAVGEQLQATGPMRASQHEAPSFSDSGGGFDTAPAQHGSALLEGTYKGKPVYAPSPQAMPERELKQHVEALLRDAEVDPAHVVIFDDRGGIGPNGRAFCVAKVKASDKNSPQIHGYLTGELGRKDATMFLVRSDTSGNLSISATPQWEKASLKAKNHVAPADQNGGF